MRVEMRYATPGDYDALHGSQALPFTRYGFALVLDGVPVAIACLRYDKSRHLVASVDMVPAARVHPFTLHRWAKKAIEAARRTGATSFFVIADNTIPRSRAWVERLGLTAVDETAAGTVYQWRNS